MPELPEAEITKKKLELLEGKVIVGFWSDWPKGLRVSKDAVLINKDIKGRKVLKIRRHGKAIFLDLGGSRPRLLALHQRMSGRLTIANHKSRTINRDNRAKHTHNKLFFKDGSELWFSDPRKFGVIWYGWPGNVMSDSYFAALGPDMLSLSVEEFKNRLRKRRGMIKPVLLSQNVVAGIGNIIADESLWRSRIHPRRMAVSLSNWEINKLHGSIKKTIVLGIKAGGTSMRDWRHPDGKKGRFQEKFKVYGRKGGLCPRCKKGRVRRILVGGRGSWICIFCQRA